MKTTTSAMALAAACLLLSVASYSQETRAFNQNSSRSNHTRGMSIFFSPVYTTPVGKAEDSLLFRGSGAGVKFGGDYFFGNVGLGAVSGFTSSVADDALINSFLKNNSIPQDQLVISKSAQQSMYLLLGPTVRFGNAVQLFAHAKGGLFINNGGLVNIQQKGAVRSIYRNEATTKSIYPGFQAGFGVQYSTKSDTWSFGFGADYMNTRAQMQNYDLRRGNGIEGLKLSRTISDLLAGVSIRYTIRSPRDAASGLPTGRRSTMSNRDAASGLPTGRRSTITTRDAASGLPTGRRSAAIITEEVEITESGANCGPVTQRVTNPDGSTSEMTFACPADAVAYAQRINGGGMPNRISMNVTTPKQTQGATFGEKVNQGLQSGGANGARQTQGATFGEKVNQGLHAAGSAISQGSNIISGNISWATEGSTGIVTNKTKLSGGGGGAAAASYASTGMTVSNPSPGLGSVLTLYSRDASSGQASGRRDKGSGMATGRRQYQPLYREGSGNACDTCATTVKLSSVQNNPYYQNNVHAGDMVEMISSNPLYNGQNQAGNNPLHKRSMQGAGTCDGIAGLEVFLKDATNGAVLARTTTEACGDFFFAHVPDGDYVVVLSGVYLTRKGYQYYMAKSMDLMGTVETTHSALRLELNLSDDDSVLVQKANINTSRSNTKGIIVTAGDEDGDGVTDLLAGNSIEMLGGALPGGAVISALARPGNPIGGISIKGGKNPGGNIGSRTTNENGEFEFTDLEAGNYSFTVEQTMYINDATLISVGNTKAQDYNSSRSNKTGSVIDPGAGGSGGSKVQDHNSSRSNKSSSIAAPGPDDNSGGNKAQDHNSSRSNKTASGVAPDPSNGEKLVASKGDVKITASQNGQSLRTISVVADMDGDGVYETDVTSQVTDEVMIDADGNISTPQQKAGISTSRSNIRNKSAFQAVTPTIFTGFGTTTIKGKEVPVKTVYKVVEKATSGLKDTLKTQV